MQYTRSDNVSVTCHHCPWTANTIGRCQASNAIITHGQDRWLDDVGHRMPSYPLDNIHTESMLGMAFHRCNWTTYKGQTMLGVACHHCPWTAKKVVGHYTLDAIIALVKHTWSTTLGTKCHNGPWAVHMAGRREEWHAIINLGQHTRSAYVHHSMQSSPLGRTHDRTMSVVVSYHCPWKSCTIK